VTPKQGKFLQSQAKYTAYVGGIRSGKTHAGSIKALMHSNHPECLGLVMGPTYPSLRDSTVRKFREVAGDWVVDFHKTEMLATLWNGSQIAFRSADKPDSTRGIEAWWAIGRLSGGPGKSGPLWITTTPNGLENWVYQKFVVEASEHPDRALIHSTIWENSFLSREFIASLASEYVGPFAEQELGGAFVEMGGTLFRREWFIDQLDVIPPCERWVRYWDLATSPHARADYTAGALVGRTPSGLLIIADMIRAQLEWPDVQDLIVSTAQDDGPDVIIGVEQVAMQLGAVQELQRREELLGYTLEGHKPDKGKYQRAMPVAAKCKAGVVKVARRHWTPALIGEMVSFTGKERSTIKDDQVDAVSGAVDLLSNAGVGIYLG